jgi:hypothetical protein
MGKHDYRSHKLHIPKAAKFKQAPPNVPNADVSKRAPQEPKVGTTSLNQFK